MEQVPLIHTSRIPLGTPAYAIAEVLNNLPTLHSSFFRNREELLDALWGTPLCRAASRKDEAIRIHKKLPSFELRNADELEILRGIELSRHWNLTLELRVDVSCLWTDGVTDQFWKLCFEGAIGALPMQFSTQVWKVGDVRNSVLTLWFPIASTREIEKSSPIAPNFVEEELRSARQEPISYTSRPNKIPFAMVIDGGYTGFRRELNIALPGGKNPLEVVDLVINYLNDNKLMPAAVPNCGQAIQWAEQPHFAEILAQMGIPGWAG